MQKACTKCKELKPLAEFFVRDKQTGRLHAQCKLCYSEHRKNYYSEHYSKYKSSYLLRAKTRREKLKQEFRSNMLAFLNGKSCVVCDEADIRVLEFDHHEPSSKLFDISQAVKLGHDWQAVLVELKKCQILCANCHKRKTAQQFGWYKAE